MLVRPREFAKVFRSNAYILPLRLRRVSLFVMAIAALTLGVATVPALATSGPGCFQVGGLPASEPLNLRMKPSAKARVIGRLYVGRHGIIAENGPCKPSNRPPSKQWCPVKIYDGDTIASGWLKMAFLRNSDCP